MTKEKDLVVQIMNEWYKAMEKNKISVQPKASTMLGTILTALAPEIVSKGAKYLYDVSGIGDMNFMGQPIGDYNQNTYPDVNGCPEAQGLPGTHSDANTLRGKISRVQKMSGKRLARKRRR